ncbi:hypothetical protein DXG01_015366 [Tephrocybe rancida]|nr:hypothetical protein DXG01_015366 [Tephrocybe rancida]
MIISSSLTIGQITFILRVAIQILTYIGLAIIGTLILGSAPRVASLTTHDTLNRIVGASSATSSTVKWLFGRTRGNPAESAPPRGLILIFFFALSYTIFVSLSDIGFLGFVSCVVPGPSTFDTPASVKSTAGAQSLLLSNTVNGTELSKVRTYHCDASALTQFEGGNVAYNCTAWRNSTLADQGFYSQINNTDTDVLVPIQLAHYKYKNESFFDYNTFNIGPTSQLVIEPIINGGLAIAPHPTGVRMVAGVPDLQPNTKVELSKAMAVEVDVGCMSLGVFGMKVTYDLADSGTDYMRTNGSWRNYTGPDYMQDILSKTVDDIRLYLQPLFNTSTIDSSGYIASINSSNAIFSPAANVASYRLPKASFSSLGPDDDFIGNCTVALQQKLGIPIGGDKPGSMCSFIGIGGTRGGNGTLQQGFERMLCAASTQVNLVDATVQVDATRNVSVNLTRLPSSLTYLKADFWATMTSDNGTVKFDPYTPYERYTLASEPKSPTSHFIPQRSASITSVQRGQGSAGNAISAIAPIVLASNGIFSGNTYAGLSFLPEGFNHVDTGTSRLAQWVGQVGGSYILGSLGYNGWAALQTRPIEVASTGGRLGSCYKPYYALGFIPLVLSAAIVLCWAVLLLFGGSLFGTGKVKDVYGGLSTYSAAMCPGASPSDTLVAWETAPQPHLRPLSDGYPLTVNSNATALTYLKVSPAHP